MQFGYKNFLCLTIRVISLNQAKSVLTAVGCLTLNYARPQIAKWSIFAVSRVMGIEHGVPMHRTIPHLPQQPQRRIRLIQSRLGQIAGFCGTGS